MAIGFQGVLEGFEQDGVIVHREDPQAKWSSRRRFDLARLGRRFCSRRKIQPHRGALARRTINLKLRPVSLGGSINHRQAETGAAIAFCSKKWFQAPAADFVVHADACVGYFNLNSLWEVA